MNVNFLQYRAVFQEPASTFRVYSTKVYIFIVYLKSYIFATL